MIEQDTEETVVVFRKFKEGDIIALFPEVPADNAGILCMSYMQIGQHSGANYYNVVHKTKRATPDEYANLYRELERIGYKLRAIQKAMYKSHVKCRENARRDTAFVNATERTYSP